MERIEWRHKRGIGVNPDEIPHPAFRNQLGNLVSGVAVRVNKKSAVALADVLDKEIHEQCGLAHAAHPFDVYMLRGVDEELLIIDTVLSD